eukprot:bmy_16233T0
MPHLPPPTGQDGSHSPNGLSFTLLVALRTSLRSTGHGARHQHCLGSDNGLCFQYPCPLAPTDTAVVPARKSPLPHGKPRGGSGAPRTVQAPPQGVGVKPARHLGPGSPRALHTLAGTWEPATRHTQPRGPVRIRAGLESNDHLLKPAGEELLLPPFCKRENQGQGLCQRPKEASFAPPPTVGLRWAELLRRPRALGEPRWLCWATPWRAWELLRRCAFVSKCGHFLPTYTCLLRLLERVTTNLVALSSDLEARCLWAGGVGPQREAPGRVSSSPLGVRVAVSILGSPGL